MSSQTFFFFERVVKSNLIVLSRRERINVGQWTKQFLPNLENCQVKQIPNTLHALVVVLPSQERVIVEQVNWVNNFFQTSDLKVCVTNCDMK